MCKAQHNVSRIQCTYTIHTILYVMKFLKLTYVLCVHNLQNVQCMLFKNVLLPTHYDPFFSFSFHFSSHEQTVEYYGIVFCILNAQCSFYMLHANVVYASCFYYLLLHVHVQCSKCTIQCTIQNAKCKVQCKT